MVSRFSRFSRWPPRWPSSIAKQNYLSDFESLCRSNASHQVSAQSNLRFRKICCLKNSNMAAMAAILDSRTEQFSNSEFLCRPDASLQVLAQSDIQFGRRCRLKNLKMVAIAAILDIGTELF